MKHVIGFHLYDDSNQVSKPFCRYFLSVCYKDGHKTKKKRNDKVRFICKENNNSKPMPLPKKLEIIANKGKYNYVFHFLCLYYISCHIIVKYQNYFDSTVLQTDVNSIFEW